MLAALVAVVLVARVADAAQPAVARVDQPQGRARRVRLPGAPLRPFDQRTFDGAVASATRVGAKLDRRGRVRRVIYPMGNADVKTPLALFGAHGGGLEELVIADLTPFGSARQVARLASRRALRDDYVRSIDGDLIDLAGFTEAIGLAGPALLWELAELGARDVRVTHLDAYGSPLREASAAHDRGQIAGTRWGWEKAATARPSTLYDARRRDVARISFLLGGKKRSILYVQQDLLAPDDVAPVLARAFERGFDAWLEKAPMMVTRTAEYQRLRARALDGLRPGGLVLSDGPLDAVRPDHVAGKLPTAQRFGYSRDGVNVSVPAADPLAGALAR